ncbi:MAG TPA: glycosyltransferase family 4 protein [Vicinamibacterales bacterium]|nr:glycosyltransferase family 4 protein [Vicinamibacterales bacterium]
MRILIANDGFEDAGGVQQYLDAVAGALIARGHHVAVMHRDVVRGPGTSLFSSLPQFSVVTAGMDAAIAAARAWRPDVCYSHNMNVLEVDAALASTMPVVKFMHGYFGTCVSGLKQHAWPTPTPCDRAFGPMCAALFFPRRCGQASVTVLRRQYAWTRRQHDLFPRYRAIVVASEHMRREYLRNGADASSVQTIPLFATCAPLASPELPTAEPHVAFLGRMTPLKGSELLIQAVAIANAALGESIRLTMIGAGPDRARYQDIARRAGVNGDIIPWQTGPERFALLRRAHLVAIPSTWPEPFGLVGLEASANGVPAIAFNIGGITEWLRPGINGILVDAQPPTADAFGRALADAFVNRDRLVAMREQALGVARDMSLARHVDRLEQLLARCCDASDTQHVVKEARWARG